MVFEIEFQISNIIIYTLIIIQSQYIISFLFQHCTLDIGSYTKDLSAICADLSKIFILDNSPGAYKGYPGK